MPTPDAEQYADKIPYELKIFEYLIENAFDMVQILDPLGLTVFVSPSVQRVLGHHPAAIVGRDPIERVHPDDQAGVRALIDEIRAKPGETSRKIVARGRHADGTWRTIECVFQNLIDDEAVGGIVANYRQRYLRSAHVDVVRVDDDSYRATGGIEHEITVPLREYALEVVVAARDGLEVVGVEFDGIAARVRHDHCGVE
ncbi:MAG: PAS domain-containing protein [Candidatus Krumholzibacteriota bacterium]|nr:PAS domain-containing protein [Candidatus Krumholzibacteriota bacterium]